MFGVPDIRVQEKGREPKSVDDLRVRVVGSLGPLERLPDRVRLLSFVCQLFVCAKWIPGNLDFVPVPLELKRFSSPEGG